MKQLFRSTLASSSLLLMVSMTIVNAGNYVYNLILGRWLGPAAFADLSLVVTLLLVVTFVTAPLQMTASRYVAIHSVDGDTEALGKVRRFLVALAIGVGIFLAGVFILGAWFWQGFFHTESFLPFIFFGAAIPFGLLQGVERGFLQGRTRFKILAATYQVEMWTRLLLGIGLVAAGLSVNGAVLGISLSFVFTFLAARIAVGGAPNARSTDSVTRSAVIAFAAPILISQLGQILINNSDVLLVRRSYPAEEAGQYAALALIGRIVFFATWSVVTTMFPIVAKRQKSGEAHSQLLWLSLGIVAAVSVPIVLLTAAFPKWIVGILFGSSYLDVANLLWLYALATSLYALANVVINYRLSLGRGAETGFAISAGILQVAGIVIFHDTLAQVVWVQVVVMSLLFLILLGRILFKRAGEQMETDHG